MNNCLRVCLPFNISDPGLRRKLLGGFVSRQKTFTYATWSYLHFYSATDSCKKSCLFTRVGPEEAEAEPSCCVKSVSAGGKKCCRKMKNLFDSGLSQVLLGVVDSKQKQLTRHENRFGITSFVYRSRRPFHPGESLI